MLIVFSKDLISMAGTLLKPRVNRGNVVLLGYIGVGGLRA